MDEGIVCTISDYRQNMTGHTPTGGCSRESSAMGESLTERHFVMDEALRGVNIFYLGANVRITLRVMLEFEI